MKTNFAKDFLTGMYWSGNGFYARFKSEATPVDKNDIAELRNICRTVVIVGLSAF